MAKELWSHFLEQTYGKKKNVEIVMECSTYTIVVPSRKVASAIC
jgi:hypothetical protein